MFWQKKRNKAAWLTWKDLLPKKGEVEIGFSLVNHRNTIREKLCAPAQARKENIQAKK